MTSHSPAPRRIIPTNGWKRLATARSGCAAIGVPTQHNRSPSMLPGPSALPDAAHGSCRASSVCARPAATQAREINKLASLSAEGRSSATTLLVSSALRWMNCNSAALPPERRKLLAFTDNRQDAALQAGHFNDFLFVALLRAATLAASRAAGPGGLSEDEFGGRLQAQANEQIALLERGTATGGSDFSTYRYLATEGFLPGYNFPRLPLYASRPTRPGRSAQPARSAAHSWRGSAACCACRRH
jgi:hypothetical protein